MRKLKLDLDALSVASFDVEEMPAEETGTVRGHVGTQVWTCKKTCARTCVGPSELETECCGLP